MMELDDGVHDDGSGQIEDQVLQLGKEETETKILWRSRRIIGFCFANQDTIEGVIGFRIDSRTMKRG